MIISRHLLFLITATYLRMVESCEVRFVEETERVLQDLGPFKLDFGGKLLLPLSLFVNEEHLCQ